MKSAVYFANLRAYTDQESTTKKLQRLFDRAGFSEIIAPHDKTAIKLHFGRGSLSGEGNKVAAFHWDLMASSGRP